MELVERKDRAVAWLDPEDFAGVAAVGHRENPRGIALEEQARIEDTGHRKAPLASNRVRPSSSSRWLNKD